MPVIMMIVVIVSSLFCYANDGEKSNDNYFVGFPAAWNCVAIVMYVLQTPAWVNIAATIFLAIMTLVPLHYTHPARVKRFQIPNILARLPGSSRVRIWWSSTRPAPVDSDPLLHWRRLVPDRRLHPYGDRRG